MTKARDLADLISAGNPLADGSISVSEVSGAAPTASPTFTGTVTSSDIDIVNSQNAETNLDVTNTNTGADAQVRTKYTTDGGLFTVGKTSNAHAFGGDAYIHNVDNTNIRFSTSDTERMRIDSSGNVGIGVSPSKRLHVYNTASADAAMIESTQAFSTLAFKSSTNSSTATFGIDGAGNAAMENKLSSGNLTFVSNGSERMRIDSSGNVGIGTSSPSGDLQVLTTTSGTVTNITHDTGGSYPKASGIGLGASSTSLSVSSDGSTVSFVGGAGMYAENTAASGNPTNLVFWTNASGTPSEKFRFGSSGQLGIGGSNYGTSGQVLTSGGSGAAPTWADAATGGTAFSAF